VVVPRTAAVCVVAAPAAGDADLAEDQDEGVVAVRGGPQRVDQRPVGRLVDWQGNARLALGAGGLDPAGPG